MVNTQYLEDLIDKSGKKREYLAEQLGLTRQGFYKKIKGKTDFTAKEIKILCEQLNITKLSEKEAIFFAS